MAGMADPGPRGHADEGARSFAPPPLVS